MAKKGDVPQGEVRVSIKPPNIQKLAVRIEGIAPYVQHRFSEKAMAQIIATQEAGSQAKSKRKREAKDFDAVYEAASHKLPDGYGIPCSSFRNASISACRTVGFKMTHAKLGLSIEPDGFDVNDATPLVRIHGEPSRHTGYARNENGSVDIRVRPMWAPGWTAELRVLYDADMFSAEDIVNLLSRAGRQVGIGEGRPDSKKSAGMDWGMFKVVG